MWPDVGIKSSPSLTKSCPKVDTPVWLTKQWFSKLHKNSPNRYLGYFAIKFDAKKFQKSPNLVTLNTDNLCAFSYGRVTKALFLHKLSLINYLSYVHLTTSTKKKDKCAYVVARMCMMCIYKNIFQYLGTLHVLVFYLS